MANSFSLKQDTSRFQLPAYQKVLQGQQLIYESFLLEVQGLQAAKNTLMGTAKDNVLKQQQELNYSLQDAARKFAKVSSSQRASAGASGISMYSQSFLDVFADTASEYTRQVGMLKDTARMNQDTLYTEALQKSEEYDIQIKKADIQKQATLLQG